jgi:hypothetical protein
MIPAGSILDRSWIGSVRIAKDRFLASESVEIAQGLRGGIPLKQIMQTPFSTPRTSEMCHFHSLKEYS